MDNPNVTAFLLYYRVHRLKFNRLAFIDPYNIRHYEIWNQILYDGKDSIQWYALWEYSNEFCTSFSSKKAAIDWCANHWIGNQ